MEEPAPVEAPKGSRRRRPPPPSLRRGWTPRRVVGGFGRLLILSGTLVLLFVVYQLWGTGIAEARSQRDLRSDFEAQLEEVAAPAPEPAVPDDRPSLRPPPADGEAVAQLEIPRIGVDKTVVEGVAVSDLKKGPGHYPQTPMPGQPGNSAFAGHRTTYGAPFHRIDELEPGDPIFVTTLQGSFTYRVTGKSIVPPSGVEVLNDYGDNRLTLTTCNPKYSAAERLIVVAELEGETVLPDIEPPPPPPEPLDEVPTEDIFDLGGEGAADGPAILWGLVALLVLVVEWAAGRWWRRWPSYLAITPVFLVVLFVFFENFARLLPANI